MEKRKASHHLKLASHPHRKSSHPNHKPERKPVVSAFTVSITDKNGKDLVSNADPSSPQGRGLIFKINHQPTPEQNSIYRQIDRFCHALQKVYPAEEPASEPKFRPYFIGLHGVARLALEGRRADPGPGQKPGKLFTLTTDAAKAEIEDLTKDLIDAEAPRIKNGHLRELVKLSGRWSLGFVGAYAVLKLFGDRVPDGDFVHHLRTLEIDPGVAANFMLLWVGTFAGVCLSYAIRTHQFTLEYLIKADSDYLAPELRLMLCGALSTLLALLCIVGLGDFTLGTTSVAQMTHEPMIALIIGAIFGISEQKMTGVVEKKTGALFDQATTKT